MIAANRRLNVVEEFERLSDPWSYVVLLASGRVSQGKQVSDESPDQWRLLNKFSGGAILLIMINPPKTTELQTAVYLTLW